MCCPYGFIFSREAILENLLAQKKANKRKRAAWEAQQLREKQKEIEMDVIDREVAVMAFDRRNHGGASDATVSHIKQAVGSEAKSLLNEKQTVSNVVTIKENEERMKSMKAFWVPSQAPESKQVLEKPDMTTRCPSSGKPLKMKDLIPIKLKSVPGGDRNEYSDPISGDSFTNASRLVVLKPTGDVVLKDTWENVIKPEGHYEGTRITDEDILELQGGGTGFADHDKEHIYSSKHFIMGTASARGQSAGGASCFGLKFNN